MKNEYYGKLTETKRLMESGEKRFRLDTETKAKSFYIQFFTDGVEKRLLTFLNSRKNSIYFYSYPDTIYIKQIVFEREGAVPSRVPDSNLKTPMDSKPLTIIVLDEQFHYLCEKEIGTGMEWNWTNSFVNREELNMERIGTEPEDDDYLTFGLFTLQDL